MRYFNSGILFMFMCNFSFELFYEACSNLEHNNRPRELQIATVYSGELFRSVDALASLYYAMPIIKLTPITESVELNSLPKLFFKYTVEQSDFPSFHAITAKLRELSDRACSSISL